ncbi:hypothetical protein ACFFOO_01835 [Mucilaginibacter ginsenosidivorans]
MLIYAAWYFAGLFIFVLIVRWIFSIRRLLSYHRKQIRLLEQIAKKHGVEDGTINEIMSEQFYDN